MRHAKGNLMRCTKGNPNNVRKENLMRYVKRKWLNFEIKEKLWMSNYDLGMKDNAK